MAKRKIATRRMNKLFDELNEKMLTKHGSINRESPAIDDAIDDALVELASLPIGGELLKIALRRGVQDAMVELASRPIEDELLKIALRRGVQALLSDAGERINKRTGRF